MLHKDEMRMRETELLAREALAEEDPYWPTRLFGEEGLFALLVASVRIGFPLRFIVKHYEEKHDDTLLFIPRRFFKISLAYKWKRYPGEKEVGIEDIIKEFKGKKVRIIGAEGEQIEGRVVNGLLIDATGHWPERRGPHSPLGRLIGECKICNPK